MNTRRNFILSSILSLIPACLLPKSARAATNTETFYVAAPPVELTTDWLDDDGWIPIDEQLPRMIPTGSGDPTTNAFSVEVLLCDARRQPEGFLKSRECPEQIPFYIVFPGLIDVGHLVLDGSKYPVVCSARLQLWKIMGTTIESLPVYTHWRPLPSPPKEKVPLTTCTIDNFQFTEAEPSASDIKVTWTPARRKESSDGK
jgi:hypothetical protein